MPAFNHSFHMYGGCDQNYSYAFLKKKCERVVIILKNNETRKVLDVNSTCNKLLDHIIDLADACLILPMAEISNGTH